MMLIKGIIFDLPNTLGQSGSSGARVPFPCFHINHKLASTFKTSLMAKLIKAEIYYMLKAAYANNHDNENTLCL